MQRISEIQIAPPQFADAAIFQENDLKRRVEACLKGRLPGHVAGVEVTVIGRTVVFRGDSLSPEERQLCEEFCRQVPGVMRVMEKNVVFETSVRDR